jgi:oligopeptide/dipeptide ABC transporter ATP-binding protein
VTEPAAPILEVRGIFKAFVVGHHFFRPPDVLRALVDVNLTVRAGEALGIVGESGSGKSTLARIIARLLEPDRGRVLMEGKDLTSLSGPRLRAARRSMQMVFQDPYSSLNPRIRIGEAIEEPLRVLGVVPRSAVSSERDLLLTRVGLAPGLAGRLPRELSGGQCQRVSIARALSVRPRILLADEPVSSLDVSVRAQILNLLSDLRDNLALTLVFISHDLSVVHHVTDRVAVMYFGHIVEYGPADDVLRAGAHPYTRALVAAIPQPVVGSRRTEPAIRGEQPSAIKPISGCVFRTRCPIAQAICADEPPAPVPVAPEHWAACHFATQVSAHSPLEASVHAQSPARSHAEPQIREVDQWSS